MSLKYDQLVKMLTDAAIPFSSVTSTSNIGEDLLTIQFLDSTTEEEKQTAEYIQDVSVPEALTALAEAEQAKNIAITNSASTGITVSGVPSPFKATVEDFPYYSGILTQIIGELSSINLSNMTADNVTIDLKDGCFTATREDMKEYLITYGYQARQLFGALLLATRPNL